MSEYTKTAIFAFHLLTSICLVIMATSIKEVLAVFVLALSSRLLLWLWLFPEEFRKNNRPNSKEEDF
ncbi:TPA: hypothetical protein ACK3JR_000325 [Mannheimia haemolytica]